MMKPISISRLESLDKEKMKSEVGKNVLVKNISKNLSARDFYIMMREFGDIKLCKFVVDCYGNSKGSGHVYYYDESSSKTAIEKLNGKEQQNENGNAISPLIVCKLILGKTKDNFKNNLYVKNFPKDKDYTEDSLEKFFAKYGEIKSVKISRDEKGNSKGFGFVCFTNPGTANQVVRTVNEKKIQFPGCDDGLYVNYAMRKDDRTEMLLKESQKKDKNILFAKLREDMYMIKTHDDFDKEIKNFMKTIYGYEYIPKEIIIKMENKTALITMLSPNHVEEFMQKYLNYCSYYLPRIIFNYYQNKNERTSNNAIKQIDSLIDPMNMFSHFSNLSVFDPNDKPVIIVDPNKKFPINRDRGNYNYNHNYNNKKGANHYNQKHRVYHNHNHPYGNKSYYTIENEYQVSPQIKNDNIDPDEHEEVCACLFEEVNKKYPE
jgi:RNA recognition motif-containing protein